MAIRKEYKDRRIIIIMKKENIVYSDKGDKVKIKKCPHCNSELIVNLGKGQTEVLTCNNCKFELKKK